MTILGAIASLSTALDESVYGLIPDQGSQARRHWPRPRQLGFSRTTVVNCVLIDNRTGLPLTNEQVVARS